MHDIPWRAGIAGFPNCDILANRPPAGSSLFHAQFKDTVTGIVYLCVQLTTNPDTYDWEIIFNPATAGGGPLAIYRQGAVAPVAPVFGTFAGAVAALRTYGGGVLLVDGTLGQPVTTAAAYDLSNIELAGAIPGTFVSLNIVAGTTFGSTLGKVTGALTLTSLSNAPVCSGGGLLFIEESSNLILGAGATGHFWETGANNLFVKASGNCDFDASAAAGFAIFNAILGAFVGIALYDDAIIAHNSLRGAGSFDVSIVSPGASCNSTQTGATDLTIACDYTGIGFAFAAFSSLTTNVAQSIPSGSGALTSSSDLVLGWIASGAGLLANIEVKFTGNAANVAGQTAVVKLQKNGVDMPGLSTAALATTAGVKSSNIVLKVPLAYARGDVITAIITPSAALTAALVDIMVGASSSAA